MYHIINILDKTIKEAHLTNITNSKVTTFTAPSPKSPEVYRLERRGYKNMATENGPVISLILYKLCKQIALKFKTA